MLDPFQIQYSVYKNPFRLFPHFTGGEIHSEVISPKV